MSQSPKDIEAPSEEATPPPLKDYEFDAKKRVDELKNRQVSKGGREMERCVQELYDSGAKMWTKEMFEDIEIQLAQDPTPKDVLIRAMNDFKLPKRLMTPDSEFPDLKVHFEQYQGLIHRAQEPNYKSEDEDEDEYKAQHLCAVRICRSSCPKVPAVEYDVLKNAWDEAKVNWAQSKTCMELTAILQQFEGFPEMTKLVCLGLGRLEGWSLDGDINDLAETDGLPRRRAMTQHAAALTMARIMGQKCGCSSLTLIAQEPNYSPNAVKLLEQEGFQVLHGYGSLAFTHVDEKTVVFTCSPDIAVKQIVADIARPAAMIWNRVLPDANREWRVEIIHGEEHVVCPWGTDEDSPRTRAMIEEYEAIEFPEDDERFSDLEIYVRKDGRKPIGSDAARN